MARISVLIMSNYDGRQMRLVRLAKIIETSFEPEEWFTVHDISYVWQTQYKNSCPTTRELSKLVQGFRLDSESRKGHPYKFYTYHENQKPLYVRKDRDW